MQQTDLEHLVLEIIWNNKILCSPENLNNHRAFPKHPTVKLFLQIACSCSFKLKLRDTGDRLTLVLLALC